MISENLTLKYTDEEEVDKMNDSLKFIDFVKSAMRIMSKGGRIRSEDKSEFCGHM
jgi:hypothetical protein